MAGSTPETRRLVNEAVQRTLAVNEELKVGQLRELCDKLGLCGTLTEGQLVGTLRSMKHNLAYRREASFDLSDYSGSSGLAVHDYVLTRRI